MNPPYRMPPQPTGASNIHSDPLIPGSAIIEPNSIHNINPALRTHSSKFPIERELILSSNKNASKIPLMQDSRNSGMQLLNRSSIASVGPELPPKQTQAWNQSHLEAIHSTITGTIPRNTVRLPEDVTALAERDSSLKEKETVKKSVTKTYHTLRDLISSKFKKESNDNCDELNNVSVMNQQYNKEEDRITYMSGGLRNTQNLNQSQSNSNIWNVRTPVDSPLYYHKKYPEQSDTYNNDNNANNGLRQQKSISQPHLHMPVYEQHTPKRDLSDYGTTMDDNDASFKTPMQRVSNIPQAHQHHHQLPPHQHSQHQHLLMQSQPQQKMPPQQNGPQHPMQMQAQMLRNVNIQNQFYHNSNQHQNQSQINVQDLKKAQEEKRANVLQQKSNMMHLQYAPVQMSPAENVQNGVSNNVPKVENDNEQRHVTSGSNPSSDNDKGGILSSNVDSGRGSATYSSGRKGGNSSMSNAEGPKGQKSGKNETEWIDVVDAELRNILEPGLENITIRPESTMSDSVSSMSPPLPPLSPDGSVAYNNNNNHSSVNAKIKKEEYGTDTYNRASKNPQPIGPSKGWPSNSIQNYMQNLKLTGGKKHEQTMMKKHLFGLDIDGTSVTNTTRSLDLESLLGGPWGGQSVSDSETETQGLRQIRTQLEGLENMYSEVLKMLGTRGNHNEISTRSSRRRRNGSLSSLPSSSVSGRPIRDRRRSEDRRKVRDIKGINKRFQRLESHVVTLARSVAHLSSEMRSQHIVSQELDGLRNDLAMLRSQAQHIPHSKSMGNIVSATASDPMNLTNPKRVKKLTKFFGEDPPLMRLFLKKLGYEKYAPLFESERVGMIELPYLGEERLQKLGVPLGPRLRILQEAQISLCKDTTLCIV